MMLLLTSMGADKGDAMIQACVAVTSGGGIAPCIDSFAEVVGWRCTVAVFGYGWLAFLFMLHYCVVTFSCGRLQPLEAGVASTWLSGHFWKTLIFVNIVLAPKDVKEWGFWYLWFTSAGLLRLLTNIGKQHFEHVVDNPRFGILLTLRALTLHAFVLWAACHLAPLGWREFNHWGEGSIGQVLISTDTWAGSEDSNGYDLVDNRERYLDLVPVRGGVGFALMLLYDLLVTAAEVCLSVLKYTANLFEMYRGPINTSGNTEAGLIEQTQFFVSLGLGSLSVARAVHTFQACGPCSFVRTFVTRLLAVVNGSFAIDQIYRASWKVVLAKELDITFPNASEKELKDMPKDEACAICLKTMYAAKKLDCQHFFHAGCLHEYLNNSDGTVTPLCPICRAPVVWKPTGMKFNRSPQDVNAETEAANGHGQTPPDLQELPGIITGNAPRPDTFTRAARGAYGAARLVHNVVRAWRNEYEYASAGVLAAAVADQVADARSREATERMVVPAVVSEASQEPAGASTDGASGQDEGSHAAGEGRDRSEGATRSSGWTFSPQSRSVIGSTSANNSTSSTPPGANRGSSSGSVNSLANAFESPAKQLLEIFPEMGISDARKRARLAQGCVQRAAEQYLSSVNSNRVTGSVGSSSAGTQGSSGSSSSSAQAAATPSASPLSPRQGLRRRWR